MPNYTENVCSTCGNTCDELRLFVKRIQFSHFKNKRQVIQSRITEYVCDACLPNDPDWNKEAYSGPGHTSLARVRIEQRKDGK